MDRLSHSGRSRNHRDENQVPDKKPRRFAGFLKGTFHHYSAILPEKLSFLTRLLSNFLFGRYSLSETEVEAIKEAAKKGPLLYVARDRSRLEYLAIIHVLAKYGLPAPRFAHYVSMAPFLSLVQTARRLVSILVHYIEYRGYPNPYHSDFLRKLLERQEPSLLFVSDFRAMPGRFGSAETDIMTEIFRCQRDLQRPIQVVPLVIIYGRKPDKEINTLLDLVFGPTAHPGSVRLAAMALRYRKDVTVRVGEIDSLENRVRKLSPRNIRTLDHSSEMAYLVRRRLIAGLDEERRVVLGPIRKSRSEIIEAALHNQNLTPFIRDYCRENGASLVDTRARVRRYLREMAADYNPSVIGFAAIVLHWVLRRGKGNVRVDTSGLENVRKAARRMPIVYVPCHKSHFDYLLVSYILYHNKLSLPYILSGINLNRWPIGGLFRRCGAFFLRRSFKGKRIYSKAVAVYVETLLREGINIEFFVEGGRSRIGKILPPKAGFISILLGAFRDSGQKDLAFVPVMIDYERIFEEKFFIEEAADKKKSGGNRLQRILENRSMISTRIGDIRIAFGEPFTLSSVLKESEITAVPPDRDGQMSLAEKIAYQVTWDIAGKAVARPYAVLATVLLANPRRGLLMDDLIAGTHLLIEYLTSRGIRITADYWGREPTWPQRIAELAVREKWIRVVPSEDEEEETIIFLDEHLRLPLTIHRNTILHFYQEMALVSLAFHAAGGPASRETLFDSFLFVKNLLSSEMIYGPTPRQTPVEEARIFNDAFEYFTGKGFEGGSDQGLVLTAQGAKAAFLYASALVSFLENYYVVAGTLLKFHKKEMSYREWVARAMKRGSFLLGLGEIAYPEAVHKTHFETAFRQFAKLGYCVLQEQVAEKSRVHSSIRVTDPPSIERLMAQIKGYCRP